MGPQGYRDFDVSDLPFKLVAHKAEYTLQNHNFMLTAKMLSPKLFVCVAFREKGIRK